MTSRVCADSERPNIIWIVVEDASPHIGCYGETTIATPVLDGFADSGIRFASAFVTCPVCSPSRSAMVTGMYQTTLGAHNHRSQGDRGKAKGGPDYQSSYRLPVRSIPRVLKDAGYFICNSRSGLPGSELGKTDYNFVWNEDLYDGSDWAARKPGQPFFTQVQRRGGKNRGATQHETDPASVQLPPYYPDDPLLRRDWADYLNSWVQVDRDVAAILARLDDEGLADSTAIFFWTDHGVSHLRGKQFLYEEGIHVPLIARLPGEAEKGIVRDDLVTQIDIASTSLALAGIERPEYLQGVDIFADDYSPRHRVFSARDRCDETVDFIRCVRTDRFKYIRNFLPHLPHSQPNQYKDGKPIVQTMRRLHAEGKLSDVQNRPFAAERAAEELYDLANDPYELINLAGDSAHADTLRELRQSLHDWMRSSGDLGLIPEPILEELGKEAGNKYFVLQKDAQKDLVPEILVVMEASDRGDVGALITALQHTSPAIRYWAATGLGLCGRKSDTTHLAPLTKDPYGGVRVAAALARCRLKPTPQDVELLGRETENANFIVGMYAVRALELLGPKVAAAEVETIRAAQNSPYEFTRRIARRLTAKLESTVSR
jgi:arylsulfatase A-like enzyme